MSENLSLNTPTEDLSPEPPPRPKPPWSHLLGNLWYIVRLLVNILLETFCLYALAEMHHRFEAYYLSLPPGMLKEYLNLICKLFLLSSFIGLLPLVVANVRETIKRLLDLFK
jgi:hypothetical protein